MSAYALDLSGLWPWNLYYVDPPAARVVVGTITATLPGPRWLAIGVAVDFEKDFGDPLRAALALERVHRAFLCGSSYVINF
jgi:hypothetical protein